MNTIVFFADFGVWCLIFAVLEAQIEGAYGWARMLASARYCYCAPWGVLAYRGFGEKYWQPYIMATKWRKLWGWFVIKYIGILGGKDFTWYHRVVDLIQLYMAHHLVYLYFFNYASWQNLSSWSKVTSLLPLELRALALLMLIWSIEDSLWFYVNPKASQSKHHQQVIKIGQYRLMEKGMFFNFINGWILMALSFWGAGILHWAISLF